jgi:hypothetical protein
MKTDVTERFGRLEDLDRSFDIAFWQAQPAAARFQATWELIVHAAAVKGIDVHQLRLQRSVEAYGRQRRPMSNVRTDQVQLRTKGRDDEPD